MQSERIILIPPTHEQSTPSFHVERGLAGPFLSFLKVNGIEAWEPPEDMETKGPDRQPLVEIEIEAGTDEKVLEDMITGFLKTTPLGQ